MATRRASDIPPELTPVEVNLLTAADEEARTRKDAVMSAAGRAAAAMQYDMLTRARQHLTHALSELDALEARLAELREKR